MHSRTTAREIIDDFKDEQLDYWVTGFGTGGTLKGVGARAREGDARTPRSWCASRPKRRCSPAAQPQERNADGSPAKPHPAFKPHPMQGWSPDFIPKLTGDAVDMKADRPHHHHPECRRDEVEPASSRRRKASSSASRRARTFAGALQVAKDAPKGSTILCMLPDTGERYLSTPLFADIPADMTEEEIQISQSTPSHQMKPAA